MNLPTKFVRNIAVAAGFAGHTVVVRAGSGGLTDTGRPMTWVEFALLLLAVAAAYFMLAPIAKAFDTWNERRTVRKHRQAFEEQTRAEEAAEVTDISLDHCSTCDTLFNFPSQSIGIGPAEAVVERINRRPTYCYSCRKRYCLGCAFEASEKRGLDFNCCPDCGKQTPDDWQPPEP